MDVFLKSNRELNFFELVELLYNLPMYPLATAKVPPGVQVPLVAPIPFTSHSISGSRPPPASLRCLPGVARLAVWKPIRGENVFSMLAHWNDTLRYTTLIIELNLHPSDTVSAVIKNYTLHIVSYNSYRTAVLHYIDGAQGFLFFWSLSVLCTGFTLGKYFVHVNISLMPPPETFASKWWCLVCACSAPTWQDLWWLWLCVSCLTWLVSGLFTQVKKSREASRDTFSLTTDTGS